MTTNPTSQQPVSWKEEEPGRPLLSNPNHLSRMKKLLIIVVLALATSVLGGVVGGIIAKRADITKSREYYLVHEGLQRQAGVYFRFLKAQDSARPEEMARLRQQALVTLNVYLGEVQELRDSYGFTWAPIDQQFHDTIKAYVTEHPLQKGKTK